jgi:hypothetical protein
MNALTSQALTAAAAQLHHYYHPSRQRSRRYAPAHATHKEASCGAHQEPQQEQQKQHEHKQHSKHQPTVRPVQESDKEAWWQLFRDYIAWYRATVADDVIELTWQRLMAGGEGNHQGLVAEDRSGQVSRRPHPPVHSSSTRSICTRLAVSTAMQNSSK